MMQRLILAAALSTVCLLGQANELSVPGYKDAMTQYMAGVNGDGTARDAAVDAFGKLAANHPGHPVLMAYQGSAIAVQGRDASMPWSKMKYTEQGANLIEKALNLLTPAHDANLINGVPESLETRLVAAQTLLALPEFLNRGPLGKRALDGVLAAPNLATLPAPVRARVYGLAAQQAGKDKRQADEVKYLKELVAAAPSSPQGQRAANRLKELGQ